MTPQEALSKVHKCVALALSAGPNESKTAWGVAGDLIRKHNLSFTVSLPGEAPASQSPSDPPGPTGPAGGAAPGTAPPRTSKPRGRARAAATPAHGARPPPGLFHAIAPRDGTCTGCGRPFPKGATVLVNQDGFSAGARHVHCGEGP